MEFPHLGEHCSEETCNRLQFLPLKCDACEGIYCTDHISYTGHNCPSAYKKDVQVPVCPLCNVPVPSKRSDPPDLAVGLHIDNDCNSDRAKNRRKVFANKCTSKGCKIKEIVAVKCGDCSKNFCLKHRHPVDHACVGKEETLRRKRLDALNKQTIQNNRPHQNNSSATTTAAASLFRNFQGAISEDEALARALQASLQDEDAKNSQTATDLATQREEESIGSRVRCRLS